MERKSIIYIAGAAFILTMALSGCHRMEEQVLPGSRTESLVLNVQYPSFDIETTKAQEEVSTDSLFAYPLNGIDGTLMSPVRQDSKSDGLYYFTLPAEATDIFFTNVSWESDASLTTRSSMPDTLLSISVKGEHGTTQDILFGGIHGYSGAGEESIAMTRSVARLRPVLKLIVGEDTVSSVGAHFDSVYVSVSGVYSGIAFKPDFTYSYFGTAKVSTPLHITETACYSDYIYTFPSTEAGSTLELRTLLFEGGETTFSTALPTPLEAGRDYTVTIYLHKDNSEAGFTLEDVTFGEDFIENVHFNDYDQDRFDLIGFSTSALLFPPESGVSRDVSVTSKLKTWSASFPSEVLSSYSVENLRTGETASAIQPTLSGQSGDTLRFTTLRDISANGSTCLDVTFRAEEHNSYTLPLLQSDGGTQRLTFENNGYYPTVTVDGYCSLYKLHDGDSTLMLQAEGSPNATSVDNGSYAIIGEHISSVDFNGSVENLQFENCTSLTELVITSDAVYEIDLTGLSNLRNLRIYQTPGPQTLDLSGNGKLQKVYLQNVPNLTSIHSGETALTQLESITLWYCSSLTQLSLPNASSLASLDLNNISSITDLNLSGCSSLRTLTHDYNQTILPLQTLNLNGCSSLQEVTLKLGNNSTLEAIDFSTSPTLREVNLSSENYSDGNNLKSINLYGCTGIETMNLQYLRKLSYLDASNASIASLEIRYADSLSTVDLTSNSRLTELALYDCYNLAELELTGCSMLKTVNLEDINALSELDMSGISTLSSISLRYLDQLRRLSLAGCSSVTSIDMSSVYLTSADFSGCASLTELPYIWNSNLTDLNIRKSGIQEVELEMNRATNLQTIQVDSSSLRTFYYYSGNHSLTQSSLDFSGCTDLDSVNVDGSQSAQFSTIILDGCPDVGSLRLSSLPAFTTLSVNDGASIDRFYMDYCDNIEQLDISNMNIRHAYIGTTSNNDQLALLTAENCPSLEELVIGNSSGNIGHEHLGALSVNGCTALRNLEIWSCSQLYLFNTENCGNLENLRIWNNYSSSAILPTLSLSGFPLLKTLALKSLPELSSLNLTILPQLESLELSNMNLKTVNCANLNRLSSISLSASVPSDTLNLSNCSSLTGLTIDGQSSRRLKVLHADGLTSLRSAVINYTSLSGALNFTWPALETLRMENNNNITSVQIAEGNQLRRVIMKSNSNLDIAASRFNAEQTLTDLRLIGNSSQLSDSSLVLNLTGHAVLDTLAVMNTYQVKSINVSGCQELTLLNLDNCYYLNTLDISGCPSLLKVDLAECNLSTEAVLNLFIQLPERELRDQANYRLSGNPGATNADNSEAVRKNWIPTTNDIASDIY